MGVVSMRSVAVLLGAAALGPGVRAEPQFALRAGLACSSCHMNVTGGGGRTAYGAGYGARTLPASKVSGLFDGAVGERLRLGADLRASYQGNVRDTGGYVGEYKTGEGNIYLAVDLLPDRIALYAGEKIAPGGAANLEAFALVRAGTAGLYAKAGRFYPPFGLRLQDDEAATRRFTGFTFESPDTGVEFGASSGAWSTAVAVTNGTQGAAETNNGKAIAWSGNWVRPRGRLGLTAAYNDLPAAASRLIGGVYGGLRAGPVVFLGEADRLTDHDETGLGRSGFAAHLEADVALREGLVFRGWVGAFDPEQGAAGDRRTQQGAGLDGTPLPGLQLRLFYRRRGGPDAVPGSRDDQAVLEVHIYF